MRIHPRCRLYLDGVEAGYIWDDRSIANSVSPNTRRPKKDGTYDHLQNCAEYTWLNYGPAALTYAEQTKYERSIERRVNALRKDYDPADRFKGQYARTRTGDRPRARGGW